MMAKRLRYLSKLGLESLTSVLKKIQKTWEKSEMLCELIMKLPDAKKYSVVPMATF
jgi:hypothetical protein